MLILFSALFEESFSISTPAEGASFSIMMLGEAEYRYIRPHWRSELAHWFHSIETRAWKWVDKTARKRPDKIFLVTGQVLASEFSISHSSSTITMTFQSAKPIPPISSTSSELPPALQVGLKNVSLIDEFDVVGKPCILDSKPVRYLVFLEMFESYHLMRAGISRVLSTEISCIFHSPRKESEVDFLFPPIFSN